jgi:hypothetical protein
MVILFNSIVKTLEGNHAQLLLNTRLFAIFSQSSEMRFCSQLSSELCSAPLGPKEINVAISVDRVNKFCCLLLSYLLVVW